MIGNYNFLNVLINKWLVLLKLIFLVIKIVIIIVIRIVVFVWLIKFNDKVIGLCEILLKVLGKLKLVIKVDNLFFGVNNVLNEGVF